MSFSKKVWGACFYENDALQVGFAAPKIVNNKEEAECNLQNYIKQLICSDFSPNTLPNKTLYVNSDYTAEKAKYYGSNDGSGYTNRVNQEAGNDESYSFDCIDTEKYIKRDYLSLLNFDYLYYVRML